MKRMVLLVVFLAAACACAGQEDATVPPPLPPAGRLLEDVLAMMPREPLLITGSLQTKGRKSKRVLNVEAIVNLGVEPAVARYTVMDGFGTSLEQLAVFRKPGEKPQYTYARGDPLQVCAPPSMTAAIQDTDVNWSDLTLSFLWWQNGVVTGTDEVKGRPCFVVQVQTPRDEPTVIYRNLRLWIDQKSSVLLRMEEYDTGGKAIRRLSVKSFKKIDDQWMIQDLEVENFPSGNRTILRIHEIRVTAHHEEHEGHEE